MGRLVALLKENGKYDETLIVFTSDHGIAFPGGKTTLSGAGDDFVTNVIRYLAQQEFHFRDLHTHRPTLDDVFLALTGRALRDG